MTVSRTIPDASALQPRKLWISWRPEQEEYPPVSKWHDRLLRILATHAHGHLSVRNPNAGDLTHGFPAPSTGDLSAGGSTKAEARAQLCPWSDFLCVYTITYCTTLRDEEEEQCDLKCALKWKDYGGLQLWAVKLQRGSLRNSSVGNLRPWDDDSWHVIPDDHGCLRTQPHEIDDDILTHVLPKLQKIPVQLPPSPGPSMALIQPTTQPLAPPTRDQSSWWRRLVGR